MTHSFFRGFPSAWSITAIKPCSAGVILYNGIMREKTEIKQELNNYADKYSDYDKWLKRETGHYIFHYLPDSEAEADIEKIAKRQERAYEKIIGILNVEEPKQKIRYYLYPNRELKKELTGDGGNAQSIFHDFSIHIVYAKGINPLGEHEDTHLLSLPLGRSIGFFQEGLAEYMAGERTWLGKTREFWLKEALEKNVVPGVECMMTQKAWMDSPDEEAPYYYAFAESFVAFLIDNFGIEKFKEFYGRTNGLKSKEENMGIFKNVYGVSADELEERWRKNKTAGVFPTA